MCLCFLLVIIVIIINTTTLRALIFYSATALVYRTVNLGNQVNEKFAYSWFIRINVSIHFDCTFMIFVLKACSFIVDLMRSKFCLIWHCQWGLLLLVLVPWMAPYFKRLMVFVVFSCNGYPFPFRSGRAILILVWVWFIFYKKKNSFKEKKKKDFSLKLD